MREPAACGVALLIALMVSVGAWPAGGVAPAKKTESSGKGTSTGRSARSLSSAPSYIYVPKTPLDVLRRYFELDERQQKQLTDMRRRYYQDRHEAVAEVEAQLNAKYTGILLAHLPGELGERFKNVQAAVDAYYERLRAIDREAREEWKKLFGEEMRYVPGSTSQVFYLLPGLSDQKRRQLQRELVQGVHQETQRRAKEELAEQGVEQPKDRKDREAWREYSRKYAEIWNRIKEETEAEKIDEITTALTEEQRRNYDGAVAIISARNRKREQAREELQEILAELVAPERLTKNFSTYPGTRRLNPVQAK